MVAMANHSYAQSRMVMNGAYINIANGAFIIIDNSAANAITRTSGHIISEGENNRVKWNIGTTTGTYTIPFGYGNTTYLPVTFTKTAGSVSGSFIFSTYRTTTWKNSSNLPSGVPNVNNSSGMDNSAYVLDRFWQVDASGYTTKPDLSNVVFTYADAEYSIPSNTIAEGNLQAQRWNSTLSKWGDWGPLGTGNTISNTVTVSAVAAADLYKWWTLSDNSSPLPVELMEFTGKCDDERRTLKWSTASEINNNFFTVERTNDNINFTAIGKIEGAGNSTTIRNYNFVDTVSYDGLSFYRLKQTDYDGKFSYSQLIPVTCGNNLKFNIAYFPNPATDKAYLMVTNAGYTNCVIRIFDLLGKEVMQPMAVIIDENKLIQINLNSLTSGLYMMNVYMGDVSKEIKLVKQ